MLWILAALVYNLLLKKEIAIAEPVQGKYSSLQYFHLSARELFQFHCKSVLFQIRVCLQCKIRMLVVLFCHT